ncbi:hypothetical protein CR205_16785 [Alteribacter lacisalsi]|uniref:Uncharacterized protein n=1 Tax=Alteribacter lacisalsi TaxID=2045244 RepID=A0A2W0H4D5_9BACI|nr:hypothetical protein [Alteribacter lacisalsi]PYZ96027.1 hypothetical protein CR205_16785 [Alteribacter lacisalsi]
MNKKDFFNDLARLIKDLEHSDQSTVARTEEKEISNPAGRGKKGILKTDYVFRARTGLPQSRKPPRR